MEDKIAQGMLALLRCGLYQTQLSEGEKELLGSLDMQQLYDLAVRHDLAHIVGHVLEKNHLLPQDDPVTELFENQVMLAFFRYKQIVYDFERICETLETAQIPFLPLKGSVIRSFYSEEWMRVSCDIDVLVTAENVKNAVKVLKEKLRYRPKGQSSHDLALYTPNDMHVELHFSLLEDDVMPAVADALSRVWDYVKPADGAVYRLELAPEMIYFYHVAHMAKHVCHGGCGVRFFMDTKLLCDGLKMDSEVLEGLLKTSGLSAFESYTRRLAEAWFGEGEMDGELLAFHQFIIGGGIYGTVESRLANDSNATNQNMFRYILGRVFPPKNIILKGYPITQKHKWLVPLFYVIRPFHRFFTGGHQRAKNELKTKASLSQETVDSVESLFSMLEINDQ
ncbi:MAG: nucleotidyltransferase family protein [Clostridia bacterium]|nr:nucleotidyltransferase family protein [Clostridia bacterium]